MGLFPYHILSNNIPSSIIQLRERKKEEETQRERGWVKKKDCKPTSTSFYHQSESCDLVKAHQEARDLALLFQGIKTDSGANFHDMYK
jgi:hypothetical protein